jgi:hypothetical protein
MPDSRRRQSLAEALAREVRDELDLGIPVNLQKVAAHLGVDRIGHGEMVEDGRTTWVGGRPGIDLKRGRSSQRTRFTLAHELGHILIARNESVVRRTVTLHQDSTERICDEIAAALLMPSEWVDDQISRGAVNLSRLRLVARRADVSLSAVAVRIGQVSGQTCVLLRWKRAPSRWVLVGQAGVPTQYLEGLSVTKATSTLLDNISRRRDQWHDVTLHSEVADLSARAHTDKSGETCLMLITSLHPSQ